MTCVQPVIRAMQYAREQTSRWKSGVDAVGYTKIKTAETNNQRAKKKPIETVKLVGNSYSDWTNF